MRGTMAYMEALGELSLREYDLPEAIERGALLLELSSQTSAARSCTRICCPRRPQAPRRHCDRLY